LIASLSIVSISRVSSVHSTCELDSHADTSCAGSNFIQLEDPVRFADVYPYTSELPALQRIPVTSAGKTWIDPQTGQQYLLILNEGLFFGDRPNQTLLCPNRLRSNGLIIHDTPTLLDHNSLPSIHDPVSDMRIPMNLNGAVS
jgi:hypothetical protein